MKKIDKGNFPQNASILGSELLAYVLQLDHQEIEKLISDGGKTTQQQHEILTQLDDIISKLLQGVPYSRKIGLVEMLTLQGIKLQDGRFLLPALRDLSGAGPLVLPKKDDPVLDALAALCAIAYPYSLIPFETYGHFIDFPLQFYGSAEQNSFLTAVINDPLLKKLFSTIGDPPTGIGTSGSIDTSLGVGGGLQLVGYPSVILCNAAILMQLRSMQSPESYFDAACELISAARSAAEGTPTTVSAFAFFDGTGMPHGTEIALQVGRLQPISKKIMRLIPDEGRPSSIEEGIAGMMLETSVDYKIFIEPKDYKEDTSRPSKISELSTMDALYERIQNVEFGTTLATIDDKPVKARRTATIIINPLHFPNMSWQLRARSYSNTTIADKIDLEQIKEWVEIANQANTQNIRLAIRRYLNAINERQDPNDGLVDAVIGLENLFGTRSEISFAISNSVARLLSAVPLERKKIFEEVKKLYNARSKIVHGSKRLSHEEIEKHRDKAIYFLATCLKKLINTEDDLVNIDASDRVKKIALNY